MDILVEFSGEVGARIIKDPRIIAQKLNNENVLLNPDTKHLQGISPSFWIRNGNLIEAVTPETAHKLVFESEIYDGDYSPQAQVTVDSKLQKLKKEIDAKRDEDVHNLLKALKIQKVTVDAEIAELKDELKPLIVDAVAGLKKRQRKIELLSFLYLIAMILIKFL